MVPWLESDRRSGVRQLGSRISRQLQRRDKEDRRLESILVTERDLQLRGYQCIGGVDEVGAGPLAGPVVAAVVIVDPEHPVRGVKDSKKLSAKERVRLERELLDSVKASALGWVSPAEIDDLNIYQASLTAMKRAVEGLQPSADFLTRRCPNHPGYRYTADANHRWRQPFLCDCRGQYSRKGGEGSIHA